MFTNNNRWKWRSIILSSAFFFAAVPSPLPHGDALPKSELPSAPLVKPVPDFAHWEVDYSYPEDASKKRRANGKHSTGAVNSKTRLRKVVVTKTGNIIHEEQVDTLDHTSEAWYDGNVRYTRYPDEPTWYQSGNSPATESDDKVFSSSPPTTYRDMDVVCPENYAGVASYKHQQCFAFTPGGYRDYDLTDGNEARKRKAQVAYVDTQSRLPIAVVAAKYTRTFQFDDPPTVLQVLPEDLTQQISRGLESRTRLNHPSDRPY